MPSSRSRPVAAGAAAGALAVIAVGVAALAGAFPTAPSTAPAPAVTVATPTTAAASVADPTSITIPAIGAESTLIPVGLAADGTLAVPDVHHPEQAAWYQLSPRPGDLGPAVIVGHVNGAGRPGVFARLHELHAGDRIRIGRGDGSTAEFTVTRVDQVAKDAWAALAPQVFGPTPQRALRLITCGGALDRAAHSYDDNIIVSAVLATG